METPTLENVSVYPAVRYHPDGRSVRVETAREDEFFRRDGWAEKPFPASVPDVELDLQSQINALTARVVALEKKKGK